MVALADCNTFFASVASFTASAATTLRGQGSSARIVTVFVSSNRFREDLPQYGNAASVRLAVPSADTLELTRAALAALENIYLPGILYKKSGVILSDMVQGCVQNTLFDPVERRPERFALYDTINSINHRYGTRTVKLAVEDSATEAWKVKSEHRTPNYLTDINELLTVR